MFLDQVWDGIKTGSLACLCALGIYCMVVGAITTVDQLAAHITAGCEKGGQRAIDSVPEGHDVGVWVVRVCRAVEAEVRKQGDALILQPVEPLTPERVKEIARGAGYYQCGIPDTERAAFINGLRHGEREHGIKGGQHGTE